MRFQGDKPDHKQCMYKYLAVGHCIDYLSSSTSAPPYPTIWTLIGPIPVCDGLELSCVHSRPANLQNKESEKKNWAAEFTKLSGDKGFTWRLNFTAEKRLCLRDISVKKTALLDTSVLNTASAFVSHKLTVSTCGSRNCGRRRPSPDPVNTFELTLI